MGLPLPRPDADEVRQALQAMSRGWLDDIPLAEKYLALLSEYAVFVEFVASALAAEAEELAQQYQQTLRRQAAAIQAGTLKEREALAALLPDVMEAEGHWREAKRRAQLVADLPDAIRDLVYSWREMYRQHGPYEID